MNTVLDWTPTGPDYRLDWDVLVNAYPWLRAMNGVPQSPRHHAEGDVQTHVRMVAEAMLALPSWRALPRLEQRILFAAALLHDVAKPATLDYGPDGHPTARGHSRVGEKMARRILWEEGVPFTEREQICGLIRWHQHPFWLVERDEQDFTAEDGREVDGAIKTAYRISQSARTDLLAILAEADARGRVCEDPEWLLFKVNEFSTFCRTHGCWGVRKRFPSTHSRFEYFRTHGRYAEYEAHDDTRCTVTVMSGLPGAGKNLWIAQHGGGLPVLELDVLRREMGIKPTDKQGPVVAAAYERAREFLRPPNPQDFIWNVTGLSRQLRGEIISLLAAYHARVRIVYVESPESSLWSQNAGREAKVPEEKIEKMMGNWEVPDLTEAHEVQYVVYGAEAGVGT